MSDTPERLRKLSVWLGNSVITEAAAEIEQLERWKAEMLQVLARWHHVWMDVPHHLGAPQWDDVQAEIDRLRKHGEVAS